MFNATLNRLPPPPFVPDHQPLRLTSDAQRPLPAGECRFILGHPQNGRCTCQSFHHNRSIPGSTCDCGHQACYHTIVQEDILQATSAAAFEARIRQLETELRLERQMRERELRLLRETLQPFYQHLERTRLNVTELEDRVEANYDEHVRLRDRVVALDDSGMSLEKRIDDIEAEGSASKRRRVSRAVTNGDERHQRQSDELSMSHSSHISGPVTFVASRSISPTGQHITGHGTLEYGPMAAPAEREGPRSSGILNLVQLSRTPPYHDLTSEMPSRRVSPPREYEEPRSSGFLALDLAERLARRGRGGIAGYRASNMSAPPGALASPESSSGDDQMRKRKRDAATVGPMDALDVLANASAVSAMAR
jgi:hypothetical protein